MTQKPQQIDKEQLEKKLCSIVKEHQRFLQELPNSQPNIDSIEYLDSSDSDNYFIEILQLDSPMELPNQPLTNSFVLSPIASSTENNSRITKPDNQRVSSSSHSNSRNIYDKQDKISKPFPSNVVSYSMNSLPPGVQSFDVSENKEPETPQIINEPKYKTARINDSTMKNQMDCMKQRNLHKLDQSPIILNPIIIQSTQQPNIISVRQPEQNNFVPNQKIILPSFSKDQLHFKFNHPPQQSSTAKQKSQPKSSEQPEPKISKVSPSEIPKTPDNGFNEINIMSDKPIIYTIATFPIMMSYGKNIYFGYSAYQQLNDTYLGSNKYRTNIKDGGRCMIAPYGTQKYYDYLLQMISSNFNSNGLFYKIRQWAQLNVIYRFIKDGIEEIQMQFYQNQGDIFTVDQAKRIENAAKKVIVLSPFHPNWYSILGNLDTGEFGFNLPNSVWRSEKNRTIPIPNIFDPGKRIGTFNSHQTNFNRQINGRNQIKTHQSNNLNQQSNFQQPTQIPQSNIFSQPINSQNQTNLNQQINAQQPIQIPQSTNLNQQRNVQQPTQIPQSTNLNQQTNVQQPIQIPQSNNLNQQSNFQQPTQIPQSNIFSQPN